MPWKHANLIIHTWGSTRKQCIKHAELEDWGFIFGEEIRKPEAKFQQNKRRKDAQSGGERGKRVSGPGASPPGVIDPPIDLECEEERERQEQRVGHDRLPGTGDPRPAHRFVETSTSAHRRRRRPDPDLLSAQLEPPQIRQLTPRPPPPSCFLPTHANPYLLLRGTSAEAGPISIPSMLPFSVPCTAPEL